MIDRSERVLVAKLRKRFDGYWQSVQRVVFVTVLMLISRHTILYFMAFLDEYSRAIVYHEILLGMDSISVSNALQKAIEQLPKNEDGLPKSKPVIRSDNGSRHESQEFRLVLKENSQRIIVLPRIARRRTG